MAEIADTIRKTEKELEEEGYELLQNGPDIWVKKTGKKNYFRVILRCPHCNSLLDLQEKELVPGLIWHETPKCRDCGTCCKSVTIQGRESVIIKKEI